MRAKVLLLSLLIYSGTVGGEAYLLIDAISIPESSKQPTWLGFRKGSQMRHIATKQNIVSVEPGIYRLHHIDYDKSKQSCFDFLNLINSDEIVVKAIDNTIVYVGLVQIKISHSRLTIKQGSVEVINTKLLFDWACDKNPEVFKRLPVKFMGEENAGKEIRIKCET